MGNALMDWGARSSVSLKILIAVGMASSCTPPTQATTTPPPQPRTGPETPPPPVVSGGLDLKSDRPARALLQQLVLGKTVRLQYDTIAGEKNASRAYVFLPDGTLVNAEMLRRGRARVDSSGPFAHEHEFKRLEQEAQASGLGIWTDVSPK